MTTFSDVAAAHAEYKDLAEELIRADGQTVTLKTRGVMSGPSSNPSPGSDADNSLVVVELKRDSTVPETSSRVAGKVPGRVGVRLRLLASTSASVEPRRGDKLVMPDSLEYTITSSKAFAPGGVTLYYTLEAER